MTICPTISVDSAGAKILIYFRLHLRNALVVGQNRCTRDLELSQNQLICCL